MSTTLPPYTRATDRTVLSLCDQLGDAYDRGASDARRQSLRIRLTDAQAVATTEYADPDHFCHWTYRYGWLYGSRSVL